MGNKTKQEKTLSLLLSGKHPHYNKFAGKHVMVVNNRVEPLKEGSAVRKQFIELKEKYGKTPTLLFVPRPDISYILWLK